MNLKKQNPFFYIIISIVIIMNISCNIFNEPEPYVNDNAHPPKTRYETAILKYYSADQIVTGNINLAFSPGLASSEIDFIQIYIDSLKISSEVVNTKNWTSGKHDIFFYVYKKAADIDSLGLLGLIADQLIIYKTSLIFDNNSLPFYYPMQLIVSNINEYVVFIEEPGYEYTGVYAYSARNLNQLEDECFSGNKIFASSRFINEQNTYFITGRTGYTSYHILWISCDYRGINIESFPTNIPAYNIKSFVLVNPGKIFYSDKSGALHLTNNQGVETASYAFFNGPARYLTISPDTLRMLAVDDEGIKQYSLMGNSVSFLSQSQITSKIDLFLPDWKNSRLFITRQNTILEEWNASTLNISRTFQLPDLMPATSNITAIWANSRYLYAAYTLQNDGKNVSIVIEYDITSQSVIRFWKYTYLVESLTGTENGRYLFVGTSKVQWYIDLKSPL